MDGDPRSLRVLEVSLKKAGFNVTTAVNGTDALEKIALALPDLILSETKLEMVDGFDLCQRLKANPAWAGIPFVFLTAQTEIEFKIKGLELGCDDYLTKPIYIKEIVTRVRILLQKQQRTRIEQKREGRTRFSGRLSDMAVVDLIQTIELSRKSGVIQFHGETTDAGGAPVMSAIYFRDGKVIDAELGALQGEDAVYRLLTWNDGEFEVVFRTVRRRDVVEMTTQALLMEGMRRLDEWGRLLEQLPNLHARFEVDIKELAARIGDIPDEHNAILKLFDGRRTLMEVIDASAYGDLETLEVIAKLYFEGLLFEVTPPTDRSKRPTEEWFPAKMLEATPTDPNEVGVNDGAFDSRPATPTPTPPPAVVPPVPAQAPPVEPAAEAVPQEVHADEEPSGATAARLAEGSGAARLAAAAAAVPAAEVAPVVTAPVPAIDEPRPGGPSTSLIFDETFQGEDATPLPGPMVEAVDDASGPQKAVVESRGADTATAHGELDSGQFDLRQSTQRELVTIKPRRASSEIPAIDAVGDDDAFTEISERITGEIPVEELLEEAAAMGGTPSVAPTPVAATPKEPPPPIVAAPVPAPREPTPPVVISAPKVLPPPVNGARARLSGPSVAITTSETTDEPRSMMPYVVAALVAVAAVLILIFAMRRGDDDDGGSSAAVTDPGTGKARPDARTGSAKTPVIDAGTTDETADGPIAEAVVDAPAAAPAVDAAPKVDKRKQAKELAKEADDLVEDGQLERGLALAEKSLGVTKTAAGYMAKAKALRRMGRTDDAIDAVDQAIHRKGGKTAWRLKINILTGASRTEEATQVILDYLDRWPDADDADELRRRIGQ